MTAQFSVDTGALSSAERWLGGRRARARCGAMLPHVSSCARRRIYADHIPMARLVGCLSVPFVGFLSNSFDA
jgi:hypothetical protein